MASSKSKKVIKIVVEAVINVAAVLLGISLEAATSISETIINLF